MSERRERVIRRVLVAMDASPASLAAADSAARLAALLEAELVGLFVEDRDLLRLAGTALAHQVDFFAASADRLDSHELLRQLRAQAAWARTALSRVAARRGVAWRFRVTRGSVSAELLAAAGEADLVSLGRFGWSRHPRHRLGSTARDILARRHRHTLLTARAIETGGAVATVWDGSEPGRDALALAARLAAPRGELVVLLRVDDAETARKAASRQLGERARTARFVRLRRDSTAALAAAVRESGAGLLVLPVGERPYYEEADALLDAVDCPLLAVS